MDIGSSNDIMAVISHLSFIFKEDLDSIAELVYIGISKVGLSDKMIFNLWTILDIDPKRIDLDVLNQLRVCLFDKLILIPSIDYRIQTILNFVLGDFESFFNFIEKRFEYFVSNKEKNYYSPLPFEGFDFINDHVKSHEDYEKFTDRFLLIFKTKKEFKLYFSRLLKSVNDPGNSYILEYIKKQIEVNNVENMILILNFLQFNEDNIDVFVEVGNIAVALDKYGEIKSVMNDKSSFSSYSTQSGTIPHEFENKIKLLEEIAKKSGPGKFRNLINSLIEDRNDEIKDHEDLINELNHR